MKSGICPKCQSQDVIFISDAAQGVVSNRYLCGNCGYIESWIDDPAKLEAVAREYRLKAEKNKAKKNRFSTTL